MRTKHIHATEVVVYLFCQPPHSPLVGSNILHVPQDSELAPGSFYLAISLSQRLPGIVTLVMHP